MAARVKNEFVDALNLYAAARRILGLNEAIERLKDERDFLRSQIRNQISPTETRQSITIGKVMLELKPRQTFVCECHKYDPKRCPILEAGEPATFMRVDVDPKLLIKYKPKEG